MWHGTVAAICVAAEAAAPVQALPEARVVAGRGLEGDRYYRGEGTFSAAVPGPDGEITLIESEVVEAIAREQGIALDPKDARRNIVTQGVPLNHLVGREFRVGEAALRGIRLCEPCAHLAGLTQREILPALVHRGGLRAQVLAGGTVRVGDPVTP